MAIPRGRKLVRAAFVAAIVVVGVAWTAGRLPPADTAKRTAAASVRPGAAYAWLTDFQARFPFRRAGTNEHAGGVEQIVATLREAGCDDVRVERLARGTGGGAQLVNVHALIPGRDRSREVVLAAHHDTAPAAPGAIDDGGAIAAIAEAARVLATGPPPACDVHVAIFDGEEWGLLGSKAHVDALGDAGRARVSAALAVELVGWRKDSLVVHTIPNGFAWRSAGIAPAWVPASIVRAGDAADAAAVVGDPYIGPWYQGMIRVLGVQTGSDAGAYVERGVPAAMLTGSSLTRFYEAYHTERDALPMVSTERLDDATRVVTAAALVLADAAVSGPSREQGDRYLILVGALLGRVALLLIGLVAAFATFTTGRYVRGRGGRFDRESGAATTVFSAVLAAAALATSVGGLVVGVPLAIGLAAAALWPRAAPLFILFGFVPLLVGVTATVGASVMFGFAWCGGPLEAAVQLAVAATALVAAVLARLAARYGGARQPVLRT